MALPSTEAILAGINKDLPQPNITATTGDKTFADFPAPNASSVPAEVEDGLNRLQLFDTAGKLIPQELKSVIKPRPFLAADSTPFTADASHNTLSTISTFSDLYDKGLGAIGEAVPRIVAEGLQRLPKGSLVIDNKKITFDPSYARRYAASNIEEQSGQLRDIFAAQTAPGLKQAAPALAVAGSIAGDPANLFGEGEGRALGNVIRLAQSGEKEKVVPTILSHLIQAGVDKDLAEQYAPAFARARGPEIEKGIESLANAVATTRRADGAPIARVAERPKTAAQAANTYWENQIKPDIENGKPVVLSGDDMKAHFGADYAPERSDLYAKANYQNVQRAIKEAPGEFVMLGGGPGAGKTELLAKHILGSGFDGILYDTSMSNLRGTERLIDAARAAGKEVKVFGIVPDLENSLKFTIQRAKETGRGVPLDVFANRHAEFPRVVAQLLEKGVLKPDEVSLYDFRNVTSREEARKMVTHGIGAQDPLALMRRVNYDENNIINSFKDTYGEQIDAATAGRGNEEARSGGLDRRSPGEDRPDIGSGVGAHDAGSETRVGEGTTGVEDIPAREDRAVAGISAAQRLNLVRAISKEKASVQIREMLDDAFPKLTDVTRKAFARRLAGLTRESDIDGMLSFMQRLENQADEAGQQILSDTAEPSVRNVMQPADAHENIDLLTRQFDPRGPEGERLHAAAQNEYDRLWSLLDQKVVDRFNQANVEKGILEDILSSHPGKRFTEFRLPGTSYDDMSLAELQATGMRTGGKAKNIDRYVSEQGYRDIDEAEKGMRDYLSMRAQLKDIDREIAELKPQVRSAQIVRGILDSVPVVPTKEASAVDQLINGTTVRSFRDISGFMGEFRDVYRNFERFFGPAYPAMKRLFLDPLDEAKGAYVDAIAAKRAELTRAVTDRYGIKRGSEEAAAIQDWGERELMNNPATANPESVYHTREALVAKFGEEKAHDIMDAAEWFRGVYDDAIMRANETLKKIYPNDASKLIPYRKDYFHHFQEFGDGFLDAIKNFIDIPSGIDPKLIGISEFTKPLQKFKAFAQLRKGPVAERDAVEGYLRFIEGIEYLEKIEPNIGKFRYLRRKMAEVAPIRGSSEDGVKQRGIDGMLQFLDNFANDLAGKTSPADRYIQNTIPGGRATIKVLNFVNNRIKANTILGNMGSALAQMANIPGALADAKQYALPGMQRTIAGLFDENAAARQSPFLKERFHDSYKMDFPIDFKNHPVKRSEEEISKVFGWALKNGDRIGAEFAWNSSYARYLSENTTTKDGAMVWHDGASHADAIRYADDKTRRLVAGRGIGEVPLFQKSKFAQALVPFTLEVENAWHWLGDLARSKSFGSIALFLLANNLFNDASEKLRGNRVSWDPINALLDGSQTLRNEIAQGNPGRGALEFAGRQIGEFLSNKVGGQYLSAAFPDSFLGVKKSDLFGQSDPNRYGSPVLFAGAVKDPIFKFGLPFGGNQIEKTYKGIRSLLDEQATTQAGKTSFPIVRTPANITRALLFGPYGTSEGQQASNQSDELYARQAAQTARDQRESADAVSEYQNIKEMAQTQGKDAARAEWERVTASDPTLSKKMAQLAQDDAAGLTANDRLLKTFSVADRASYIVEQLNSLKTKEEKQQMWSDYVSKKIITPDVSKAIEALMAQ